MKKIFFVILLALLGSGIEAQDILARTIIDEEQGEEIVEHINFLYSNLTNPKNEIDHYLQSLQPIVQKEVVAEYYLARFRQACQNEEPEKIIHNAQIYLLLDVEEDLPEVYSSSAKAAESIGNTGLATYMMSKMKRYSVDNDNWLEEEIEELEKELAEIRREWKKEQRQSNWNEGIKGVWVAVDYEKDKLLMVDIVDIAPNGAELIYPGRNIIVKKKAGMWTQQRPYSRLGNSQSLQFDGPNRSISMQFASSEIKDKSWLAEVSQAGLESTRDFRTESNTIIRTSNASFEEQLAASLAVGLASGLMDALFTEMSVSSRTEEFYSLSLSALSGDVMEGEVYHNGTTIYSDGRVSHWADKSTMNTFVRWEPEDSIVFFSSNNKPLTAGPIATDNPILKDYKAIKWHNSFFNPRNLIPAIAGMGLGGWIGYTGIRKMIPEDDTKDISIRGAIMFVVGFTTAISAMGISFSGGMDGFDRGLLNKKGIDKIKRKMQTELSLTPAYNPDYDALGASLNLSF